MTRLPARRPLAWGERPSQNPLSRVAGWIGGLLRTEPPPTVQRLPDLPAALRRSPMAPAYVDALQVPDHPRAAAAAGAASEHAVEERAWWAADAWAHRALWHFERVDMTLAATRQARVIGDIRVAAGDPAAARRYYAEAIAEARDIGAEREQGLAALGLGRAELELGNVTAARRLASAAVDLLDRGDATPGERAAARELRGEEKEVGGTVTTTEGGHESGR